MIDPESTQIDDAETTSGAALAVGSPVRVPKLDSLIALRGELGRLYRECRRREGRYPDAITGLRLANILNSLRQAFEVTEITGRLDALEKSLQTRGTHGRY